MAKRIKIVHSEFEPNLHNIIIGLSKEFSLVS